MRTIFLTASLISLISGSVAMAEDFTLESTVSAVTIYGEGATITRTVSVDIPAGRHRVIIADVPLSMLASSLRIQGGEGLIFGATTIRDSRLPPSTVEIAEREVIEAQIETLEQEILAREQDRAAVGLRTNAAAARVRFLESLSQQQAHNAGAALESTTLSIETLSAMVTLIGDETLKALEDSHAAQVEMAQISQDVQGMRDDLRDLLQELDAVSLPPYARQQVSVEVTAAQAMNGIFQISYLDGQASWKPIYDFHLATDAQMLTIDRKVQINQHTGENWKGVAVTVSTSQPTEQTQLNDIRGTLASYFKPQLARDIVRGAGMETASLFASPQAVMMDEAEMRPVSVDFQGVTAVYHLPEGTQIDGDGEPSIVTINSNTFDVDLTAQVNLHQSYGNEVYLIADFVNTSRQPYLPGQATYLRDGAFIGTTDITPMIAPGGEGTFGFGQIDGMNAQRITVRKETGESGVITTSNDRVEEYRLEVENASGRDWNVIAYSLVPYSEQEDLLVEYSARPRPNTVDVDGKRGVLAWEFPLESGESTAIRFNYTLEWPENTELNLR